MSQSPQPPSSPSYPAGPPSNTNVFGVMGFIVSLIGLLLTCGLLCPLGLLISLIGLFKPPRGMAITGTILGVIGSFFLAIFGFGMVLAVVGPIFLIKSAAEEAITREAIMQARNKIEQHRIEQGSLPDGVAGNKLILEFKDAWKHELRYDGEEGGTFVVRSMGPDGKFDTPDDIIQGEIPTTTPPEIDIPDMPTIPGGTDMPEMPDLPEMPDKEDMPEVPGETETPAPPESPEAPTP